MKMEITNAQRKRLLHAYETLAVSLVTSASCEQQMIARAAWKDIQSVLGYSTNMWDELHGQGSWPNIFTENQKAWESLT